MRICYICGGKSIKNVLWLNYFTRRGHEVHLISRCKLASGGGGYEKDVQIHPLIRLFPRIWSVSGFLSALLWPIQVRILLSRIKPDVVDAHFITVNGYLAAFSFFHPFVLNGFGSDILIDPKRNFIHRFLTKYSLKKADLVICNSETIKAGMIQLDTDPTKIREIYKGVDTQKFSPKWNNNRLRSKGVNEAPTIISIRNLTPIYNVEMLIRAIPLVLDKVPEAKFIICGDGEQRDYLERLADSLGIASAIRFVGWIPHEELPKYLASSDIYVSTSLSDSCPVSLQEAMACELPPVVTDIPANREWITGGKNGYLIPINDAQLLAGKIIHLIKNKRVRETFGKLNREIIKEKAEYKREMERMERLYRGLLRR